MNYTPEYIAALAGVTLLIASVAAVIIDGAVDLVRRFIAQRPAPRRHALPVFPPSRLARYRRGELPLRDFLYLASAPPLDQDAPVPPPRHSMEDTPTGLFVAAR